MSELKLMNEKERFLIKQKADETRAYWCRKGFTDIFSILDNAAFFIRKPMNSTVFSGFTVFYEGIYVVFLNSSFTLGHERFSGAHELYHLTYDKENLYNERLLIKTKDEENEEGAQQFAAEFLMPEEGVKELYYKLINVNPNNVEPRHVVKLQYGFKVSYAAMTKRLTNLGLCDKSRYNYLREYGSVDKHEELEKIIIKEGFSSELIKPSKDTFISTVYLDSARQNYENGKISYNKLQQLLKFINKDPEDYGYKLPRKE